MSALPCPPQDWTRFSTLLDEALELPEPARDAWLCSLQGGDLDLRPWLTRVLASAAGACTADFLSVPALDLEAPDDVAAGDVVGPYRLLSLLGHGGMGQVWRAAPAEDGPARDVALKLPHPEMVTGPFRARFRRERDLLGALTHPNIATLYDASVAASGQPYLALELVAGAPITAHCEAANLSLEQRVALIGQVLAALGYAHARLIVHRDIKPSNVLVTADGVVKLLDFGIALLLDPTEAADGHKLTQAGRLATPGYAAPEQMEGGRITVATDLFAAGILLFELCTGERPPRLHRDGEAAPLASSSVASLAAGFSEASLLRRRLRGDLDAIIAKALSVEPADRYGSAETFARDLRRWQDGLPVSARRIGRLDLAGKFVRRNPVAVGLAALLAVALAIGILGVSWQAHRAEREAARAVAVKDFLIALFEQGDATNAGKRLDTMTAREMLDAGADRADSAFVHDPATEIELLETLGNIYGGVDQPERAERMWQRRLDLATVLYGPADPIVFDSAIKLVYSDIYFLHDDAAKALLDRIRQPLFARYDETSQLRAWWLSARASALRATPGGREEALRDDQIAIAIYRARYPKDPHFLDAMRDLDGYQYDSERYDDALATIEKLRDMNIAAHQFTPFEDLAYRTDKASSLQRLGRRDEADANYQQVQVLAVRLFGTDSAWYQHALIGRAQMAHLRGDRARAWGTFHEALALDQHRAAATGQSTSLQRAVGAALDREGRFAEAIATLEPVLKATLLHPHDEQNVRRTRLMLADAYDQAGRTGDARAQLSKGLADWLHFGPADGAGALGARERWARFLLDHDEASAAATEYRAILAANGDRPMIAAALAESGLARIALAHGLLPEAQTLSTRAMKTLSSVTLEYDVRASIDIRLVRAAVLRRAGDFGSALSLAKSAEADAVVWDDPSSGQLARVRAAVEK